MTVSARVEGLLDQLTLDEQVALLAGIDFWHTVPIERIGIPSMRVSDGPVGARGTNFNGPASIDAPCSTLLAATWDPALVERIGQVLGRETAAKGARVLLAPTVNLHRTPVGGRNFECMSEDPYLTARTAVAYVRGVQSERVACCIKHFVGNDTEFERNSINSVIDERTLRELYYVPFEAAVREAGVLAVMTSYNRMNGPFAADSLELLQDVLRGDWAFDGLVMSDWFGLHSTVEGIIAGLDLEMPGPTQHRGDQLLAAVRDGLVEPAAVRRAAANVLTLMERVGSLDAPPGPELTRDSPEDEALVREAATAGMVLLRNADRGDGKVLPLVPGAHARVAVIGPNAAVGQIMGGGSAHVTPTRVSHPLDALRARLGGDVVHALGCQIHQRLPEVDMRLCTPFDLAYFADPDELDQPDAVAVKHGSSGTSRLMWTGDPIRPTSASSVFGVRISTTFTPDVSGAWSFGVASVHDAKVLVDGVELLNNAGHAPGGSFFGMGRTEITGTVTMEAGQSYQLVAEMRRVGSGNNMGGLNLGALAPSSSRLLDDAIDLAATTDCSILVVGTNDDWESEGWDRTEIALPGDQDELIRRVAQVSPRTIVVVNAGSPVAMPWLDEVDAVLLVWFPGQAMGDAIADVLLGEVEPQGRLPVTFPARLEDTPAFEHHPGRNGVANYREGRLMGYRWYDTIGREPLFPFGFGLGYATTRIADAHLVDAHTVTVDVVNDSPRDGVEVVQVYASALERVGFAADEPRQRLVGFAKVPVAASSRAAVTIALDPRAYEGWSVLQHAWVATVGAHELRIGRSSRDITVHLTVKGDIG